MSDSSRRYNPRYEWGEIIEAMQEAAMAIDSVDAKAQIAKAERMEVVDTLIQSELPVSEDSTFEPSGGAEWDIFWATLAKDGRTNGHGGSQRLIRGHYTGSGMLLP